MVGITGRFKRLCAFVIGVVFFVSGILKLIDPVGVSLIVGEYFSFFHIGFMSVTSKFVAVVLSLVESFTGLALMTGVFRLLTFWVTGILLSIFALITLLLWIFNPSMDCGCFGQAVHLTHFQSFAKNVVLILLYCAAFFPYGRVGEPKPRKFLSFSIVGVSVGVLCIYSLMYIPLLDLTPFSLSSRLAAADSAAPDSTDMYVSSFVYEKNGKKGVFTLNNIPDSTWTFVEALTVPKDDNIKESDYPSLSFTDARGRYCDEIAAKGLVMALSVYAPGKLDADDWEDMADFISIASKAGFTPLLLVAASPEDFAVRIEDSAAIEQKEKMALMTSVYYSDYRTLVSMNRSNGGAVYFNNGNLISKWAARALPGEKKLSKIVRTNSIEFMLEADNHRKLVFQTFLLYSLGIVLLI